MNEDVTILPDESEMQRPTRVFILASSDLYVDGINRLLSDHPSTDVVAISSPNEDCWEKLRRLEPDLVLVNCREVEGVIKEFFGHVKECCPTARVLVFGVNMEDDLLVSFIRAGVNGYVNEQMSSQNLIDAVLQVSAGSFWVQRRILENFVHDAVEMDKLIEEIVMTKIEGFRDILTARESDVFQFVLQGMSTKEISMQLYLSEQSVKLHLGRLFKKFEVTNKTQLVLLVFEKVCQVSNMIRLFRMRLDRKRIEQGKKPLIEDPLEEVQAELS